MNRGYSYSVRVQTAGLLAALVAVGAFVTIPIPFSPAPLVLQNLFVLLAGLLLPAHWAAASVAVYLLLGAAGLPIFAGGTGGLAHFVGPTGGYLLGFVVSAPVVSLVAGRKRELGRMAAGTALGVAVVYATGVPWLHNVTDMTMRQSVVVGVLPFLPGDALKAAIAVLITRSLPEQVWRNLHFND